MLINASRLEGCPILSLHVGGKIAQVSHCIVDPDTLKIIAFQVEGPLVGREAGEILPVDSIREFSRLGIIVDSVDELIEPDSVIRIRDVLQLNFSLVGLKTETKSGAKVGKVSGYTVDPSSWRVQQLIIQRPFLKSFLDPELIISRQQIVSVDDYKVIIKDDKGKQKATKTAPTLTSSFINPFREPDFAPEMRTKDPEKRQ